MYSYSYMVSFLIFVKSEAWWGLSRAAETCIFLDYYNKVLYVDSFIIVT